MVESIKELKKICRKRSQLYSYKDGKKGKPVPKFFYHRFIDSISIYLTKALLYTNVTANQVTIFSIFVGIAAGILFAFQDPVYWLWASLVLQFYFILDGVDGDIARYRKTANPIGKYYDIMAPAIVIPATLIGMTFGVYWELGNPLVLLEGFIIITFFLAAALSNATKSNLLNEFALKKKGQKTLNAILGKAKAKYNFDNGIPLNYTIKKLLSFQGLAMLIIVLAVLDMYIAPFEFSVAGIPFIWTYRGAMLLMLTILTPLMFISRFYKTSKLKDKVMKEL